MAGTDVSCLMVCILVVTVLEVSGQAGTTQQACRANSPECDSTDDVCFNGKCVTRSGRDCSSTPDGCIPGASCVSGICACTPPFIDNGLGYCLVPQGKVGSQCNSTEGVAACEDAHALCNVLFGSQGFCECSAGYVTNRHLACDPEAPEPPGTTELTCGTSTPQCNNTDDVCIAGKCVTRSGRDCSNRPDGCIPGASCVSGICACTPPLIDNGLGYCSAPAGRLGGPCSSSEGDGACTESHTSCNLQLGVCECAPDYQPTLQGTCERSGGSQGGGTKERCRETQPYCDSPYDVCYVGTCVTRVGGECRGRPDGCTAGADCQVGVCTCLSPWTHDGHGQCVTSFPSNAGSTKEACKPTTPECDKPDDVCFAGTCLTRGDGNCSISPDGCVPGASCVSENCTCNHPLVGNGFGLCVGDLRQVGGQCNTTQGRAACIDPKAFCSPLVTPLGVCTCRPDHQPTLQATCVPTNKLVGGGCVLRNGQYACIDPNAECKPVAIGLAEGVCTCRNSFIPTRDGFCKLTPGLTTAECLPADSCTSPNDTCIIAQCKTMVGGNCTENKQCVPEATCNTTTSVCTCISPYYEQDSLCVAPAGMVYGPCNPIENGSCEDPHARCKGHLERGHCLCKDPYFHTANLTCEARPGVLHGLCDALKGHECEDISAECVLDPATNTTRCSCLDGFSETSDDRCLPQDQVGVRNGPCGFGFACKNPGDRCFSDVCKIPVGGNCSKDRESCVHGAVCESDRCHCQDGFADVNGMCYGVQGTVGGTCDARRGSEACRVKGAQCSVDGKGHIGTCVCVHAQATLDGTCSSVVISSSLALLLLCFVTSYLF